MDFGLEGISAFILLQAHNGSTSVVDIDAVVLSYVAIQIFVVQQDLPPLGSMFLRQHLKEFVVWIQIKIIPFHIIIVGY